MAANLIRSHRDGMIIDWTATAAVTSGSLRIVGTAVGVCQIAGATGDVIPVRIDAEHTLTKPTGVAFGQGAAVYTTSSGVLTGTDVANIYVGMCSVAATSGAGLTDVRVILKGAAPNALTI